MAAAAAFYEESLAIKRELGDRVGAANSLANLADVRLRQGQPDRAAEMFEEALALHRDLGRVAAVALTLAALGHLAVRSGDRSRARERYAESIVRAREANDEHVLVLICDGVARCLADAGWAVGAAEVTGAGDELVARIGRGRSVQQQAAADSLGADLMAELGSEAYAAAVERGRGREVFEAIHLALARS